MSFLTSSSLPDDKHLHHTCLGPVLSILQIVTLMLRCPWTTEEETKAERFGHLPEVTKQEVLVPGFETLTERLHICIRIA